MHAQKLRFHQSLEHLFAQHAFDAAETLHLCGCQLHAGHFGKFSANALYDVVERSHRELPSASPVIIIGRVERMNIGDSGGFGFGRFGLGEWDDDEDVAGFIDHEFEATSVAAIDDAGQGFVLLVVDFAVTCRTRPQHRGHRKLQPSIRLMLRFVSMVSNRARRKFFVTKM
jgi:hypothetical protein